MTQLCGLFSSYTLFTRLFKSQYKNKMKDEKHCSLTQWLVCNEVITAPKQTPF